MSRGSYCICTTAATLSSLGLGNQWNFFARPSGQYVQTTECIRLPTDSWVTLNADNYSHLTLGISQMHVSTERCTPCSITLRNISRDNYLCMASIANMPITGAATCTQMKSRRTRARPLWKSFINCNACAEWCICYGAVSMNELDLCTLKTRMP